MFGGQRFARLKFKDQAVLDENIGIVVSKDGTIYVRNFQRELLLGMQACFS